MKLIMNKNDNFLVVSFFTDRTLAAAIAAAAAADTEHIQRSVL